MTQQLRTPEQVAADLGAISQSTIRTLIRTGQIEYTKLARGKFALTDEQVDGMLSYLSQKQKVRKASTPRATESVFPQTDRSKASRRRLRDL